LPFPKFDEQQTEYYNAPTENYTVLCVPVNTLNVEMVGALVEALSAESKYTVMPAFYEAALQGKYTRDNESLRMLDMIMNGRNFDIATLYTMSLGDMPFFIPDVIRKNLEYTSSYAEQERRFITLADKVIDQLNALP